MSGVDARDGSSERVLDVLIVSQPGEFGVAVCVRQLAEAAVAAGHRVVVACPDPTVGPLAEWITQAGAVHVPLNLQRRPALSDLRGMWILRSLVRGRDVVHLHSSKAGAVGRIAVASLRRRHRPATVLFTTHCWSWQVGGRLAVVYRWAERLLARLCDAIVAVSDQEAADGRAVLGSAAGRITVIPNGVDRRRFSPDGPRASRRSDAPLITCVGRLSRQKGQDLAISALARLRDRRVRLRLVGDEYPVGEKERLAELAAALGVADRVEWRGNVADAAPELRAADVVIAPSRWEGMSLVFLEAMACGAALVVTDVSGSDAVGPGGLIVPRDDVDALAGAIDALLGNEDWRRKLGVTARQLSALHDVDTTLARNLALWSRSAGDQRASRPRRLVTAQRDPTTSDRQP